MTMLIIITIILDILLVIGCVYIYLNKIYFTRKFQVATWGILYIIQIFDLIKNIRNPNMGIITSTIGIIFLTYILLFRVKLKKGRYER